MVEILTPISGKMLRSYKREVQIFFVDLAHFLGWMGVPAPTRKGLFSHILFQEQELPCERLRWNSGGWAFQPEGTVKAKSHCDHQYEVRSAGG